MTSVSPSETLSVSLQWRVSSPAVWLSGRPSATSSVHSSFAGPFERFAAEVAASEGLTRPGSVWARGGFRVRDERCHTLVRLSRCPAVLWTVVRREYPLWTTVFGCR